MIHSSSETTTVSPTPISPFSAYSVASEATSDESPDLGAFTTVFRALTDLQPPRTLLQTATGPAQASQYVESDSELDHGSTVWSRPPIAHYLSPSSHATTIDSRSRVSSSLSPLDMGSPEHRFASGSDTEGVLEVDSSDSDEDPDEQPSLGDLVEALNFLAAERARVTAQREMEPKGNYSSTSDSAWRHVIEPRRKRRRKKTTKTTSSFTREGEDNETRSETTELAVDVEESSSSYEASSIYPHHKSTPGTPPRKDEEPVHVTILVNKSRLKHSKSTPILHLQSTTPPDPEVIRLRCLAHKLRLKFPEDDDYITALLASDFHGDFDFSDPRGPAPRPKDTLIHVFIDHSNILIGLLSYIKKRHTRNSTHKSKRLSHAALALLLERGRPISRRCLVASSPLYQPVESAEQLGYEVRVFARVPDSGDGQDRRHSNDKGVSHRGSGHRPGASYTQGHAHRLSGGHSMIESEQAGPTSTDDSSQHSLREIAVPSSSPLKPQLVLGSTSPNSVKIRYREQGVDELLQLKLHQAIADVDVPPPNATIVLATGDGNVGQFNDDGFLGPIRTALKKGWRVELYAWEEGLSKAWRREFSDGPFKDRFRIIKMEDFGEDLVDADYDEGR